MTYVSCVFSVTEMFCGRPRNINHGSITGNDYYFEGVVLVQCDSGYKLNPPYSNRIQCLWTGRWSDSDITCPRKYAHLKDKIVRKHKLVLPTSL